MDHFAVFRWQLEQWCQRGRVRCELEQWSLECWEDQFCKHKLRIKYYVRYMDDFIILHENKKYLHEIKSEIEVFLNSKLELHLNNKTCIRPINSGIDFVGFKIWPTHKKLKKKTSMKIKKRLKYLKKAYARREVDFRKINSSVQSYLGILKHCNSYKLQKSIFKNLVLTRGKNERRRIK